MRVYETVVISDIEKAFLQVSLQSEDRDVTRFLWFKNDKDTRLKDNIKAYRFKRVNFGVISSPFLLAATLDHHLTQENTKFAEALRGDIYVDNVITGLNDDTDAKEYHRELKALFNRAGMNIQEFCSNSRSLMDYLPDKDKVLQTDVKVLGMRWDSQNDDTLRLNPCSKLAQKCSAPTKRMVLQAIASVFDPLGFFQPVLLPAKCLLQKLWELKYGWDDPIVGTVKGEWDTLRSCFEQLFQWRVPRFVGKTSGECTLAVFCDASARAYSTSVYLRCRDSEGPWRCNLIFSKSRLSPSSGKKERTGGKITLPRLELLGAVIGVRAAQFCRKGLKIPKAKVDFFIDSQCVLQWIGSRSVLKRFVANRIEEIRKVKDCEFHYVSTNENPADYGTRGKLPEELFGDQLWWHGPQWLTRDRSEWPESKLSQLTDDTVRAIQDETKPPVYFSHTITVAATDGQVVEKPETDLMTIDPKNISSFRRLVRVSMLCMKFLKRVVWNKLSEATKQSKPKLQRFFDGITDESVLTADDFQVAKTQWIKDVQQKHYGDVLAVLQGVQVSSARPHQVILQLGLHLDSEGVIRSRGRFENSDLPAPARDPILLPKDVRFTELVARDIHWNRVLHSGVSHTLNQIRQEYWIPQGRAFVRRVLHRCLVCRRYKTAMPYKLPKMPPWPKERVSRMAPFQTSGLDYFGPIIVKMNDENKNMWVSLFTCLATRAVHLEPVMDCTAHEFLHALIRFVSRRGVPDTIIADNAGQFQLVQLLGDQAWRKTPVDEAITSYSAAQGIRWKYITELAPWQGGFYERLVGLVKSTLRTSIRRKLLNWTDFVTLLTEAEAVVNSRPLTYVNSDIDSGFQALRPCDFLIVQASSLTDAPDGGKVNTKEFTDIGKRLADVWRQRCRTLDKLWQRWYEDYLVSLRERRKVSHKAGRGDVEKVPLIDQVVLICDPDLPRGRWRLGRIMKLLPSSDGRTRAAELLLANGYTIRRALNHLVPLEVEPETASESDTENAVNAPSANHDSERRDIAPVTPSENRNTTPVSSSDNLVHVPSQSVNGYSPTRDAAYRQSSGVGPKEATVADHFPLLSSDSNSDIPTVSDSYDKQPRDTLPEVEDDTFYYYTQSDIDKAMEALRHFDDLELEVTDSE
jgi:hypothetical protein